MRWYALLRESRERKELQKRKVHTTHGTAEASKVYFGVFSLFSLASIVTMPKHQTNTNAEFTEQFMNRFHEVNKLYYGTLNKIRRLFYSTEITTNETFTFRESMKQDYRLSFMYEM